MSTAIVLVGREAAEYLKKHPTESLVQPVAMIGDPFTPAPVVRMTVRLERSKEMETFYDLCLSYGHDAGRAKFLTEDSRSAMDVLLRWANEFNQLHATNDWLEMDYLEAIDDFYIEKRKELDVDYVWG